MALARLVVIQLLNDPHRHARRGEEIARRLVDLHNHAFAHEELAGQRAKFAAEPGPAVECKAMRCPVAPLLGQQNLLVVAIAGRIGLAIDVGQGFRMAEFAGFALRQIERHRRVMRPLGGYGKLRAHHEIGAPGAPIGVGFDHVPTSIV